MQENWISHFSGLLKTFEAEDNGKSVHEFRRSFEAGKKQMKVLPQVEKIYLGSKDRSDFRDDPVSYQKWFNQQNFNFVLGLKSITLHSTGDPNKLWAAARQVCSKWEPELYIAPPPKAGGEISQKKLKQLNRVMGGVGDSTISNIVNRATGGNGSVNDLSDDQLAEMFPNEKGRERAKEIMDRVKTSIHK